VIKREVYLVEEVEQVDYFQKIKKKIKRVVKLLDFHYLEEQGKSPR
jgi:hypothetical protein